MTSKKPAASKRTNLPRASDYTKDFLKDWQRLSHSGRYDMNRLKEAMTLLANDGPLPPQWLDHALTGDWAGHRKSALSGVTRVDFVATPASGAKTPCHRLRLEGMADVARRALMSWFGNKSLSTQNVSRPEGIICGSGSQ
jgi:mRNA interferase YafQ